jgi:hypothetical protein
LKIEHLSLRFQGSAHQHECYFWATHGGAELDLLAVRGGVKLGFEFKRTDSPAITPSMRSAIETLGLKSLAVIHAGAETFPLSRDVQAIAARDILDAVRPLRA